MVLHGEPEGVDASYPLPTSANWYDWTRRSTRLGSGWSQVLFSPGNISDPRLQSATARIPSTFGPIEAAWSVAQGIPQSEPELHMWLTLPADVSGRIVVPSLHHNIPSTYARLYEGETELWDGVSAHTGTPGLMGIEVGIQGTQLQIRVGSGEYHFVVRYYTSSSSRVGSTTH